LFQPGGPAGTAQPPQAICKAMKIKGIFWLDSWAKRGKALWLADLGDFPGGYSQSYPQDLWTRKLRLCYRKLAG
jgi:hypothetical protein